MKKLKLLLVAVVALLVIPFAVNAKSKITVHIFRGEGCGYCKAALEYFDSIKDEYGKYFKLEKHEVWYDEDNAALMQKVAAYFDEEVNGVPYIIIGDKTFQGYAEQYNEEIIDAIMTAYNSGSFVDRVVQVNNGEVKKDTDSGKTDSGEKKTKKEEKTDKTIYIIIAVALVGFIALIYFARDTKDDFEVGFEEEPKEEKVEEVVEVKEEPKKEEVKKTTTKKPAAKKTTAKKTTTTKKTTAKKTPTKSKSTKK